MVLVGLFDEKGREQNWHHRQSLGLERLTYGKSSTQCAHPGPCETSFNTIKTSTVGLF